MGASEPAVPLPAMPVSLRDRNRRLAERSHEARGKSRAPAGASLT